jgi:hypothetical protein
VPAVAHGDQELIAAAAAATAGLRGMMAGEAAREGRQVQAPRSFIRHDKLGLNWFFPNNGIPGPDGNQPPAYRIIKPKKEQPTEEAAKDKPKPATGFETVPCDKIEAKFLNADETLLDYWRYMGCGDKPLSRIREHVESRRDVTSPVTRAMIARLPEDKQDVIKFLVHHLVPQFYRAGITQDTALVRALLQN